MPLPTQLILPIGNSHPGKAPSAPASQTTSLSLPGLQVCVGDAVAKYQLLFVDSSGANPVFAPSSGSVAGIEARPVAAAQPAWAYCLILALDGKDLGEPMPPLPDFRSLPARRLRERLAEAGLKGLGGAGYPTFDKLDAAAGNIHTLIINGIECEPYITADEALLREQAKQVVNGSLLLQAACEAEHCILAIEQHQTGSEQALRDALSGSQIELRIVPDRYPSGAERQLIYLVTGTEIPHSELPIQHGYLVHNVGTAFASFDAIVYGIPQISRVTTLTGGALRTPKNFFALFGTPLPFLMDLCGIDRSQHSGTVIGGSLMGLHLAPDAENVPVTASTNCIIAKGTDELTDWPPERPCIRCGDCIPVCPARLQPQLLYQLSKTRDFEALDRHGLSDCIECGACAHVCPSTIPLVQYYRAAKEEKQERSLQRQLAEQWQNRFQYHQYRTRKRQEERLQRRTRSASASPAAATAFSRNDAQKKIAAAVARVKAKRADSDKGSGS